MTGQITTSKRIKMACDGTMIRVACDDGSVIVIDTVDGDAYKLKDNHMVSKPINCPHKHTEPYIVDPASGNVDICLDCGEMFDPDLISYEDIEPIEF